MEYPNIRITPKSVRYPSGTPPAFRGTKSSTPLRSALRTPPRSMISSSHRALAGISRISARVYNARNRYSTRREWSTPIRLLGVTPVVTCADIDHHGNVELADPLHL